MTTLISEGPFMLSNCSNNYIFGADDLLLCALFCLISINGYYAYRIAATNPDIRNNQNLIYLAFLAPIIIALAILVPLAYLIPTLPILANMKSFQPHLIAALHIPARKFMLYGICLCADLMIILFVYHKQTNIK